MRQPVLIAHLLLPADVARVARALAALDRLYPHCELKPGEQLAGRETVAVWWATPDEDQWSTPAEDADA